MTQALAKFFDFTGTGTNFRREVIAGSMMVQNVLRIDWKDFTEAFPAFLTLIGTPLTFSIADGTALGFISSPIVKLAAGRGLRVSLAVYILMAVFLLRYLFKARGKRI